MPSWLRNALAAVVGFVIGGVVNMALIAIGARLRDANRALRMREV